MYASSPENANFDHFPFDGDQRLITGRIIYNVNNDIVKRFNNFFIVAIYMNQM